jgi:hypothetical protein
MNRVSKAIVGGLSVCLGTGLVAYLFLMGKGDGTVLWFICLAATFSWVGIIFLYKALNDSVTPQPQPSDEEKHTESILERNNAMLSDWSKTNQTRDKLKVLEMAAQVDEGK